MSSSSIKNICITSIFSVLIVLSTILLKIPVGGSGAYINLGDSFIFISTIFLTKKYSVSAASLSSGICDLILGAIIYIVPTIIIKGLMAFVCFFKKDNDKLGYFVLLILVAEILMSSLYFVYETFVFSFGVAIYNCPFNLLQGVINIIIASFLYFPLKEVKRKLIK